MPSTDQPPSGPPALQDGMHFLQLLEEVCRINKLMLDEATVLRARVRELEAQGRTLPSPGGKAAPAAPEGRQP